MELPIVVLQQASAGAAASVECGWLCQSFQEHSVVWLVMSAVVGGIIGGATDFLFKTIVAPRISATREARSILRQYTVPLCLAADALENRLNNLIRSYDSQLLQDPYYRMSTLCLFCHYLGWVRILERRFGYIGYARDSKTRELNDCLRAVWGALASVSRFFKWHEDPDAVGKSAIPQLLLRAAGDAVIAPPTSPDAPAAVIEFAEFVTRYGNDAAFKHWIALLEPLFDAAGEDLQWDRIILTQLALVRLIDFLDPDHVHARERAPRNVERFRRAELAQRWEAGTLWEAGGES